MVARSQIYITRKIPGRGLEMLRREFGDVAMNQLDRSLNREELEAEVAGRQAVLCMLSDQIDGPLLAAAADCKIFANYAVGYDNVDVAKATRRGILVSHTPGVLTDATADLAWTLLMGASRRVLEGDTLARSGRWHGWSPTELLGADFQGQTLGIVGAGRIGAAVAMRSRGWDMNVLYVDKEHNRKIEAEVGATRVNLEVLLRQSDFVSLHVPLSDETQGLMGAEQFQAMKETAVLVNTSRGKVVDEVALVDALRTGQIAAAGLDTYAREPRLAPGLADLHNVVLLPHLGSATIRTRGRMSELAAGAVISALKGDIASNVVNPEAWTDRPE